MRSIVVQRLGLAARNDASVIGATGGGAPDASVDPDIYDPDLEPRLSSGGLLTVRLPWGDATVDLSAAPARVRITQP